MPLSKSPVKPRVRVAICGGGIAGLCLTVALSKYPDVEVNVYEAAQSLKEIGAGVMVWGRAWSILTSMGLDNELRLVENIPLNGSDDPMFGFDYRRSDQPQEGFLWKPLRLPYVCILFHRARFLDVLAKHLPAGVAHLRKRLTTYTHLDSGVIQLKFSDGTSATCDVLLGCDGIKSAVRRRMFEDKVASGQPELAKYIEPFFSGTIAYRVLVPREPLLGKDGRIHPAMEKPMMYCGVGKHVVSYGIAGGTLCNIVALSTDRNAEGKEYNGPWVSECSAQELVDCYDGWEPEVRDLLKSVHPRKPMKWAIHQLHPLPFFVGGNVALVGDAAHAMTPHQGSGAVQAIEDAYVLANLLGHPSTTLETLSRVLKAYEYVRLPMANHVLNGSRMSGMMSEMQSEHGDNYEVLGPAIERQWDWVRSPDPQAQVERALQWCYPQEKLHAKL